MERCVIRLFFDGHGKILAGLVEGVVHEVKHPAGPPRLGIPRRQLDGCVEERSLLLGIVFEFGEHKRGSSSLQLVVTEEPERLGGGRGGPLAIASRQGLQAGDHELSATQPRVAAHRLVEVSHREGTDPRPLGVGPGRLEDRLHKHSGPVDERAGVELLGKLPRLLVEPLVDRLATECEDTAEVVKLLDGKLGVDRGVEVFLPGGVGGCRGGGGVIRGRVGLLGCGPRPDQHHRQQPTSEHSPAGTRHNERSPGDRNSMRQSGKRGTSENGERLVRHKTPQRELGDLERPIFEWQTL